MLRAGRGGAVGAGGGPPVAAGGGGATLTEQAKRLLRTYRAYQADVEAYARTQFEARFAEFR